MGLEKIEQEWEIWKDYTEQKKKNSSCLDLGSKICSFKWNQSEGFWAAKLKKLFMIA